MGVYAITGGSGGIGAKTREILIGEGHEVINIDLAGGEIDANLAKPDGRQHAIDELCRMCPDGLDGLYCNAGVAAACGDAALIIAVNYFGAITLALNALPIPTKYGHDALMDPEEIAEVMVFLSSYKARGINGNIIFVDGGTDALLNNEKVY